MFDAVNNMEYITLKVGITMFDAVNNMEYITLKLVSVFDAVNNTEGWHHSL